MMILMNSSLKIQGMGNWRCLLVFLLVLACYTGSAQWGYMGNRNYLAVGTRMGFGEERTPFFFKTVEYGHTLNRKVDIVFHAGGAVRNNPYPGYPSTNAFYSLRIYQGEMLFRFYPRDLVAPIGFFQQLGLGYVKGEVKQEAGLFSSSDLDPGEDHEDYEPFTLVKIIYGFGLHKIISGNLLLGMNASIALPLSGDTTSDNNLKDHTIRTTNRVSIFQLGLGVGYLF